MSPSRGHVTATSPIHQSEERRERMYANILLPPPNNYLNITFWLLLNSLLHNLYSRQIFNLNREHYCKILGLREFSLFSSLWVLVTFCRTIFTIYWTAQYFGVAQNGIIMGHFTVCQTYYYDEIENIILLLTQRLQSQPLGRQHNNKTSVQRMKNRIC